MNRFSLAARVVFPALIALITACTVSTDVPVSRRNARQDFDDVTNGLQSNVSRQEGTGQSSGQKGLGLTSFGASTFIDTNGDGLPDTRLPSIHEKTGATDQAREPGADANATPAAERMMVYQGAVALEVARADEAIATFLVAVKQWGGYVSSQHDEHVVVRVPSVQFEPAMIAIRGMGRVLSESRSAEEVTKQFVDLGIRLDNAKKSRDRLLALMDKATQVEDILKIEEQLRRLTEEIERMEGEQKFLADQVAMAKLTVVFNSVATAKPGREQRQNRFGWINLVGATAMLEDF